MSDLINRTPFNEQKRGVKYAGVRLLALGAKKIEYKMVGKDMFNF